MQQPIPQQQPQALLSTPQAPAGRLHPAPHPSFPKVGSRQGRRAATGSGARRGTGSALPAASHLLNLSLAAKDAHVCIKLLSSQSNSGTSDSNYRYITGADKSGARQPGTCQRSAADAPRGAQRGRVLSHPLPALFWGSLCTAQPPGTSPYTGVHSTATSPLPLQAQFGKGAPSPAGFHSPSPCSGGRSCICRV